MTHASSRRTCQEFQRPVNESVPEWYDDTGKRVTRMPDAIHLAASSIVFNEKSEILLQKRADNGWWGLPSGHVDIGESVEQGAVREIWEETGIHTRVKRLVGIYSDPQHNVIAAYPDGSLGCVDISKLSLIISAISSEARNLESDIAVCTTI